jgi:muramoyltetrapeptide carboxypeptidase
VTAQWKPLTQGEPIGVVALSGPSDAVKLQAGVEVLRAWGHPIVEAPNLQRQESYLAGGDDERLAGIEDVVKRGARCLIAARGGYGAARLLGAFPWKLLQQNEVRLVGFSDLTAILNPLARRGGTVQVHGPMVAAGFSGSHNVRRLLSLLRGELVGEPLFRFSQSSVVRPGTVEGRAVGGNLSVLSSLMGTPWEPDFDESVVFLEEVGEPLYRLDRMLTHLRSSGRLRKVKALIGGSLHGCRPASERTLRWRQLLLEVAPPRAAVVVDLPFGHGAANLAFPIGATVQLDTRTLRVMWR